MTIPKALRFASAAELDQALSARLAQAIGGAEARRTAVMLSGGRTPLPAYRALSHKPPRPAPELRLFYSDDRYVPSNSPSSNYFQSLPLIESLRLTESAVLRVPTELPLEQAAADYGRQLETLLDSGVSLRLGLLGLGADGHTASLFNETQLEQARGQLAIAVQRPDGLQGISVTPEVLSRIGEILFLVAGADKGAVVGRFLEPDSDLIARRAVAGCPNVQIWIAP